MKCLAALRRAFATIPLSDAVVERYGAVRADLQTRGVTKSDFDLLIACSALEADAVLVSADRALLDGTIPGLRSENWLENRRRALRPWERPLGCPALTDAAATFRDGRDLGPSCNHLESPQPADLG